MKGLLPFLLVSATIFSSCQDGIEPGPDPVCTNNTGWLRNGHEFVYVNNSFVVMADSFYYSIDELSPGIFKTTSIYDDGTLYPEMIGYLKPCGNSIFQSTTPNMDGQQEAYRVDGNIGDSWSSTGTSLGGVTVTTTTTIIAKNVSVSVPAGTFNTLHLRSVSVPSNNPMSTVTTDQYLDNNAGLVKLVSDYIEYELARKNY